MMLVLVKPLGSKCVLLSFFTVTYVVAGFVHGRTIGSVWCWATSILAPLVVLANYCVMCNSPSMSLMT
jgi:hypothetical protein